MEGLSGGKRYEVPGLTMNGEPYLVTVHKSLLGKVISGKVDAAKLALLPHIPKLFRMDGMWAAARRAAGSRRTTFSATIISKRS